MTIQHRGKRGWRTGAGVLLMSGFGVVSMPASQAAQTASAMPDAQVEANVLKALAAAPELSTQDIQSSTVYGVVRLSGTVQTEVLRVRAENLAARAQGVKKVVDELTLGTPTQISTGTGVPDTGVDGEEAATDGQAEPPQPATAYQGASPVDPASGGGYTPAQNGYSQPAASGRGYDQSATNYPPTSGPNGSPSYNQPGYGQPAYPPANSGQPPYVQQPPYSQPGYAQQPAQPYAGNGYGQVQPGYGAPGYYAPQGGQAAGLPVTVASGALLRVRINRGLDSNHLQPGTPFDGTVLSDVAANGFIAIPRGASVQGVVVDARHAGAFKGEGELALQITNVQLGGSNYPLVSDVWEQQGRDKSVRTVNSALGLGVLGAIVGGVAGGGAGAAVGAGVGAGVGVAGAAASPGGQVIVPPEAVLNFHLAQPAALRTVSEGEMQRLAYGAGPVQGARPVVRRRVYPYGAYGPYGYPYAYRSPY